MILPQVRAAIVAAIEAETDCPVKAVPPAEDTPLTECIWIRRVSSRFEWRSIASMDKNRTETVQVELALHVYREHASQNTAAATALARCEELLASIESAIVADMSLANLVSFGRAADVTAELTPRDKGWTAVGTCRIEASNYPA
jgi:hypothetical protein